MTESIATQTTSLETKSIACNTDSLATTLCSRCGGAADGPSQRLIEDRSINELIKSGRQQALAKGGSDEADVKPVETK